MRADCGWSRKRAQGYVCQRMDAQEKAGAGQEDGVREEGMGARRKEGEQGTT